MNTGREVESCVRIFKQVLIQVKNILPPLFAPPGLFFSPWITAALTLSSVLQRALRREAAPGPGRCSAHSVASMLHAERLPQAPAAAQLTRWPAFVYC